MMFLRLNLLNVDIDECSRDPSLCRGGHCVNTEGSYRCQCAEGHELMPGGDACKGLSFYWAHSMGP